MNPYLYTLLTLLVIASGGAVLFFKLQNGRWLKLLLAFSGAYLFGISLLHLLPEVYELAGPNAGIYILAGFFVQLFLEYFSRGIEHGHVHLNDQVKNRFPLAIFISLCLHSFLEGMPIDDHEITHGDGHHHGNSLLLGIVFHKIPVAVVLMALFVRSGLSKVKSMTWLLVFAAMMPLGTAFNHYVAEPFGEQIANYPSIILGLVLGILLHISTTILFESNENHAFNRYKFATIIVGILLAFFSL